MTRRTSRRPRIWLAALVVAIVAVLAFVMLKSTSAPAPPVRYGNETMQAVVHDEYGPPDVIAVERVRVPLPGDRQVVVEVRAAAVNPLDWHYLRGTPYVMRFEAGLRKPNDRRLGADLSGRVVAVGAKVTRFKAGDDVFGTAPGAFAEFALASEDRIVLKPAQLSYEQAAAVPVAALTALQGLRDKGRVEAGDRVLINGASGGVGTFAVQIAKTMGAHVTAVCSGRNADLVRSLGADEVIDYTRQDFTQGPARYDVVLDLVGNRALLDVRRVLVADGRHVLIGGGGPDDGRWLGPIGKIAGGMMMSPFVSQGFGMMLAKIDAADLAYMNELMTSGKVTPVIDRRYVSLAQVRDAIEYLERGRARGKVVVTLAPPGP